MMPMPYIYIYSIMIIVLFTNRNDDYNKQVKFKQMKYNNYQTSIIVLPTSRNDDYDESIVTLLSTGASIVKVTN